ncbi:hypothetical protein SODALDRAFT_336659 [Sodiomyces alkalinus F11]|uniref:Ribosomal protein L34 n=1 Tax=Sodiomyces alkalinus (strain CBS 110278 / VKM F-3762 / F11) TaxID=1314773 RepID=A0A3N2Q900_SODAK|nr:hypothetical protein SODALDRAFT_336659 [Sodiomyces alkalinus F11]ROT43220.1 hypothetical protein SODALDRAFT_336659 [Sodiomyces alkalinus F11]
MIRQSIASVTRRAFALPTTQTANSSSKRLFSSFVPLRPTLSARPTVFARPTASPFAPAFPTPTITDTTSSITADLVPKTSITAHPALALSQIRCGPRNTMNRNTRLIQKRRHGFVSRMKTKSGRKIIKRRKAKGRLRLGCST